MAQMLAPEVRSQFAQRLKTLRTQRGFDRARYFAKSLGIGVEIRMKPSRGKKAHLKVSRAA